MSCTFGGKCTYIHAYMQMQLSFYQYISTYVRMYFRPVWLRLLKSPLSQSSRNAAITTFAVISWPHTRLCELSYPYKNVSYTYIHTLYICAAVRNLTISNRENHSCWPLCFVFFFALFFLFGGYFWYRRRAAGQRAIINRSGDIASTFVVICIRNLTSQQSSWHIHTYICLWTIVTAWI